MKSEGNLVYSSSSPGQVKCKRCNELSCVCQQTVSEVVPGSTTLRIRIEKKGRGGKTVTVIYDLPHNPDYFKKLLKKMKNYCGSGGSLKGQQMEIQGDQRSKVKKFLEDQAFKVKGG